MAQDQATPMTPISITSADIGRVAILASGERHAIIALDYRPDSHPVGLDGCMWSWSLDGEHLGGNPDARIVDIVDQTA
jgi:hypothetical protein